MDPTTLVTFLFKAPPEVQSVELVGSWDNFGQPYQMHHDRRRGAGSWSGCFKFEHIIFDGDTTTATSWSKPRSGGLKQGGTYWYYYRLDDDREVYDHAIDTTSVCPLLPGQRVNVIEVPMEMIDPPQRTRSASIDVGASLANLPSTHTLDPDDKFARLEPPPISKVHGRCISDIALNGKLESQEYSSSSVAISPPTSSVPSLPGFDSSPCGPSPRYYANGTSSPPSLRSWVSDEGSFDRSSSVFDAYCTSSPVYDDRPDSTHLHTPLSPTADRDGASRACSRISDVGFSKLDFELQDSATAESGANDSARSLKPSHDISLSASRPTTSHGSNSARPRFYSLSNDNLEQAPTTQQTLELLTSPQAPASAPGDTQADSNSPGIDTDDVSSPTFSAATLSDTGGLTTPLRLSGGYSRPPALARRAASSTSAYDESIESVVDRLRGLDTNERDGHGDHRALHDSVFSSPAPSSPAKADETAQSTSFPRYVLPTPALDTADGDEQRSRKASTHDTSLPLVLPTQNDDSSFAAAILDELRFLGGRIS